MSLTLFIYLLCQLWFIDILISCPSISWFAAQRFLAHS